jgi:hypothetical protein
MKFIPLHDRPPVEQRAFLIYYAKVSLREAGARRQDRPFSATLFSWAQKARRQAALIDLAPAQGWLPMRGAA